MNDFYALLRQTIIDRGLSSARAREEAYAQARQAMINRLWSYDPPLAEDEIDHRIGQFDSAVSQIEDDVIEVFEAMSADAASGSGAATDDGGYAPSFGGAAGDELPPAEDDAELPEFDAIRRALDERSLAVERALNYEDDDDPGDGRSEAAPYDADLAGWSTDEASRGEPGSGRADADRQADPPSGPAPGRPARTRARPRRPVPRTRPDAKSALRGRFALPALELSRTAQLRLLIAGVAVLAVMLAAGVVWVLVPGSPAPAASPVVLNTEVPGGISDPDTAIRIPKAAITVTNSFTLFDGNDPTVFLGDPDNPVRYDGAVARIATSVASAGARVAIGPGLSTRLGGETVRVTIEARAGRENGATSMRFAYQSGVAISHWQTANLSKEFTPLGLVWRVPKLRTSPQGDYLIIEPGVPGSGTGVEIRSVKIELVEQ